MEVTNKIVINMQRPGVATRICAMQGDEYSRVIEATLVCNAVAWEPPEGTTVQVCYTRADGAKRVYSELPDGSAAGSISGNVVRLTLAPQVLSRAGEIRLAVTLVCGNAELSTFPLILDVTALPGYGGTEIDGEAVASYTGEVEVE